MQQSLAEVGTRVRLLDVDPDLEDCLAPDDVQKAAKASSVATVRLRRGEWAHAERFGTATAFYVVEGFVARRVCIDGRSSVELLGPGQVLRPGLPGGEESIHGSTSWQVLSRSWLAVLDAGFQQAMAPYPRLTLALFDRVLWRSRSLSIQLAIASNPSLHRRILVLLWHLADSYGRVSNRGVMLPVPLSHEILADMTGATRPAVSKRIGELTAAGALTPLKVGFVLHPDETSRGVPGRLCRLGATGAPVLVSLLTASSLPV